MPQDTSLSGRVHQAISDSTGTCFDPRYLAAKKVVDDRALNRHVWRTLRRSLPQTAEPLSVLEIGAGIGTMFERIIDRGLLAGRVTYLATDSDPGQLRAARIYLSQWAGKRGHALTWSESCGRLTTAGAEVSLILLHARAEDLGDGLEIPRPLHLLIAHAVLDLFDFPAVLPHLFARLTDNGLAYLTCNFDGETVFLPEGDEQEIVSLYHASMEERLHGASHTGRRLLTFLQDSDLELLAAGRSDWRIHPRRTGYSREEAFFLHSLVETVERELAGRPCPPSGLAAWGRLRHVQIDAGELSFQARHLDLLARRRSPSLP
jgi:hypothetical protein